MVEMINNLPKTKEKIPVLRGEYRLALERSMKKHDRLLKELAKL